MPDVASEAFAEFLEHRDAIVLIHNAKKEGFEFVVRSDGPAGYYCSFVTNLPKGEWNAVGNGIGKTLLEAATKAWETTTLGRSRPILNSGEWHQALSIAGELTTSSEVYAPIPGCELAFTMSGPRLVEVEALVVEMSRVDTPWNTRYQIVAQVDGLYVPLAEDVSHPVPQHTAWRHYLKGAVRLAAGVHAVKLGFRIRPMMPSNGSFLNAVPHTPILLNVRC